MIEIENYIYSLCLQKRYLVSQHVAVLGILFANYLVLTMPMIVATVINLDGQLNCIGKSNSCLCSYISVLVH